MKTTDFENAIIKMNPLIILDEVKLSKGHVRRFYGHIGKKLIMWDEKGKGYTCRLYTVQGEEEMHHDAHVGVTESCFEPDRKYDIHFENKEL